jgi:NADH-ubiquinone oxidoreductase chain 4
MLCLYGFAFLVKMPMFMGYLRLSRAHVEAPVSGSIILAGFLLKFGGYGLLHVFLYGLNLVLDLVFFGLLEVWLVVIKRN